jgi:hypothetical protein
MQAGNISPDHMPLNKYELLIVGMPKITFITVGSFTDATTEATLPDGTVASGGKSAPIEFNVTVPRHHLVDVALMDNWKKQGRDPIDKNYKKTGTLISYSGTGAVFKSEQLRGLWVRDKTTPEFDMGNDGEMAVNTYVMRADGVDPV